MIETLFHAYTPLLVWTGLGLMLFRFIPKDFPKLLGLSLYWVGVPLQIFVLARQTEFSGGGGLTPIVAVGVLLLSINLAVLSWRGLQWFISQKSIEKSPDRPNFLFGLSFSRFNSLDRSSKGSFILAAMLGNTGFVGLALTQALISHDNSNWAVLYSVTNNVIGTYGVAVLIASYFGHSDTQRSWWKKLQDVLTVPSLWAFIIGFTTRNVELPSRLESGLEAAVWVVIACALLLLGIRLGSLRGWQSLELALIPSLLKVVIVPGLVGLGATYLGLTGEPRLVLVLMSGTPTALAVLILAEVYDLNRELLASNIAMTSVGLLMVLPLWVTWFG
ncbi:MAG TPA: transporter [Cyanobacteria bacterium UBA8553]|nr:transporter [Cyanobacteria bacterium UBA8553]HAJ58198.1 transporter [Cyanobacteria bacterium UBA8543]